MYLLKRMLWLACVSAALALGGCDPQRISELEEGVSTEADVRARFGEPEKIWDAPDGGRTFEYSRQPQGHQNYMITIGTDGKMSALRQVLTPLNFAKVQPGMMMEDVRKLLGKPMKTTPFKLKNEVEYDWRYLEPPNKSMVFTVVFDMDYRVLRTLSVTDPDAERSR
ncbi:Beta-barrel assembly machine subunit BamE [Rhodoferax sp. OV413]|uniref:outer membrane protein assembly factor BamE domain-containing protein n=1 Tax=Rhodoferax sp. OV413 TaxID=1855285 RepID=UPI00087F533C|nr:outer membrane protein assembly factor BamE [Rhodoferax sp. OV413]SDP87016.1 Beta-barrel assembly machine subunit BamE [Rhodoferax sp. OV413]